MIYRRRGLFIYDFEKEEVLTDGLIGYKTVLRPLYVLCSSPSAPNSASLPLRGLHINFYSMYTRKYNDEMEMAFSDRDALEVTNGEGGWALTPYPGSYNGPYSNHYTISSF
jgi:hypothetical protein